MMRRTPLVLLLGLATAACEQESQTLPFSLAGEDVVKSVPSAGAVVTNPAGASLSFPAGSVGAGLQVSIAQVSAPAAAARSGASASSAFRVDPAGTALATPAEVELRFDRSRSDAWLATLVNHTPTGVHEVGNTRVDLSTGLVQSRIEQLGTVSVVIPEPRAVFRVSRAGSRALAQAPLLALAATGTDSVRVECGDPDNRCSGLQVSASGNLLSLVEDAAVVYPRITGTLRINGSTASGRISLTSSFRAQLRAGATAENVEVNARIVPTAGTVVTETASEIHFTQMRFTVSGSGGGGSGSHEEISTLSISKTSAQPSVMVSREFQVRNSGGELEDASVSVAFPVRVHQ